MSRILITGGAGFIGSHLTKRLLGLGHQVTIAESFARGARDAFVGELLSQPGAELVELDLRDPAAAEKVGTDFDIVYHLAAIVGVANVLKQPYTVLYDNMLMLGTAMEIARRQQGLTRFVFTSTSEVYAGTLQHMGLPFPTPETTPLVCPDLASPRTSYMLSKIYGEALCKASGLPVTIFRPHNIYGPRMGLNHVIPELLQKAYRAAPGDEIEVFSVDHKRTFCFIDDAVEMIRLAVDAPGGEGQVLNLGNEGPEVAIGELAGKVIATVGTELTIVPGPVTLGSPTRRAPDTAAIRALTGYESTVSVDEGIARTFDWYRTHMFDAA